MAASRTAHSDTVTGRFPDTQGVTSVKIIISAGAGLGDNTKAAERLAGIFQEDQFDVDIALARSGAEVIELAREAAREPYNVVVAAGGDGTINSVAAAIIDTDKILGVLPLGTLNHFAKDLGIPTDLQQAARTIIAGHTIEVDAAEVNNRIFLNNSSLGLYPMIVREREKRQRLGFRKWPAFVWATIQALRRNPFLEVRLRVKDELIDRTTPFVFVVNNEYAMDLLNIGARDRLDRGELSIYITHGTSRLKLIALALRAVVGRLRNDKDFLALRSDELTIHTTRKRVRVAFDGEIEVMEAPLHYRVRSRALRVIVPKAV
ncbi:MAG TPA: diacylglycerol kinase family protein [Pyrinomonadaceae bacterium]|nr:diacylglycerol kinase family protein [Pyrinomonadaceae bacterium]